MSPKVIFLMAGYGHDPTETAVPWKVFSDASFSIHFATKTGKQPAADSRMLTGTTGALLGATKVAKTAYQNLQKSNEFKNPLSWTDPSFTLSSYDLVFLPGGHDKGVRQIIDSAHVHSLLAAYFPLTLTASPNKKSLAAICHGVQVLAHSSYEDGKSLLHDATTTSLLHFMEESIYQATRVFLGDYYKTYGAGTLSVQRIVEGKLDDKAQFKSSMSFSPFVVKDPKYNYLSARFPPDAEELGRQAVEMVTSLLKA